MTYPIPNHRYTFEDYLAVERASEHTHEFFDGEIYAMADPTPEHERLVAAVLAVLARLGNKTCTAYGSKLRIRIPATGLATYPDASVVCGPLELDPADDKHHTVTNPKVVVEVLSPTTEDYDRGGKFEHYKAIPTLEHYVLVAQDAALIEVRSRDTGWVPNIAGHGQNIRLSAIDCELSVDAIYGG